MAKKDYIEVAKVRAIYRYPVKSFAGESIASAWIGWHGMDGDRRFAFLKLGSRSGFPWLTARDCPPLLGYQPFFTDPENMRNSPIYVRTPDGRELPMQSEALREEIQQYARNPIHLLQNWSGVFDAMDLSLISTTSIEEIGKQLDLSLGVARFRPNILIEPLDQRPFAEDRWLKNLLVFGDGDNAARIRIHRKTLRCMVVNVDTQTARQNPAILKHLVRERKNQLGVYGSTERPGKVEVGSTIYMVKS